ncbi:alpha/beta fold hydrolase [Vallitalea okinawensis]|uniref:alpha/beta fold hydrolase n=1 Tax=Vallitalea okinawensis TaxID=2078660 RepID=UPI000CFCC049|nr:alpha/beta hydrolase [Vallitalea okinawensis]
MSEFHYNNKKIYFEVHGEGQPLIILNGIMMSHFSWKIFLPHLTKDKQVILLDFIDQGFSDKAEGLSYKHELQVEVLKGLVDHLNLSNINLVGVSYGAQIALQFAMRFQEIVEHLMVFNVNSYTSPWLHDIGRAWVDAARTYNPSTYYNVTIPYIYSPKFYNENYQWMSKRRQLLNTVFDKPFLDAMIRLIESSEGYDIREQLNDITAKTLIVASDHDYITPLAETEYLHHHIKESDFVMLKECGHASMYERPNEFVALINGFMQKESRISIV